MGGGIADNTNTAAASLVQNSILVNNIASNTATAQWFNQGTVQPISAYNIIQGNLPSNITDEGGNLPNTNPLFLNTNDLDGADNKWGTPDDGIRLSPCSPAINSGIAFRNGVQVNSTLKDLINHSRLRQTVINRGAYEDMDISGYTETVNSTNSSVTADAECSDAAGWTHYVNVKDELLVLSIQKDGNPIGAIGDGTFIVKNATTNAFNTIATQISPSVAPYAPGYWFVANRYWGVTPTTQLHNNGSHVKVRMYYTATDENDLMLRLGHLPLPSDIIFYKMNGHTTNPLAPSNPNPALGHQGVPRALQCGNYGAWLYAYYTASDTVTWTNNSFNGIKYGEFEVKRFSGGGFGIVNGGPVLLPIKLLAFTGRVSGSNNVLDWKTASEQNSSHFIVERSTDGENFEMVGRVLAAGNSATILNYTFTDKAFTALLNYYRLRMTDKDGSYEYSKIIALERKPNKDGGYLQVTPNPANDAITINYQNIADNVRNMKLINELGQVLMDIPIQVDKISTANVATLPAAVYMIQLTTENNVLFIQKVVVTH
jgi:hypothetical protein